MSRVLDARARRGRRIGNGRGNQRARVDERACFALFVVKAWERVKELARGRLPGGSSRGRGPTPLLRDDNRTTAIPPHRNAPALQCPPRAFDAHGRTPHLYPKPLLATAAATGPRETAVATQHCATAGVQRHHLYFGEGGGVGTGSEVRGQRQAPRAVVANGPAVFQPSPPASCLIA